MGPAFETFITLVILLVIILAAAAWFGRDIWRRLWQFLRRWHEEDRILEEAQKEQQAYRKQAEKEVADCLHDNAAPTVIAQDTKDKKNAMPGQTTRQATEAARQNVGQEQEK